MVRTVEGTPADDDSNRVVVDTGLGCLVVGLQDILGGVEEKIVAAEVDNLNKVNVVALVMAAQELDLVR